MEPVTTSCEKIADSFLKIENFETRSDAEFFKGLKLLISRKSLPKIVDGEFYHSDLLNFKVYNLSKENFGEVISLEDFGAGLLVQVKKNNKTFLSYHN